MEGEATSSRKPGKPGAFLEIIYDMEYYFQPKITEE
jgi:hypothetical protein